MGDGLTINGKIPAVNGSVGARRCVVWRRSADVTREDHASWPRAGGIRADHDAEHGARNYSDLYLDNGHVRRIVIRTHHCELHDLCGSFLASDEGRHCEVYLGVVGSLVTSG